MRKFVLLAVTLMMFGSFQTAFAGSSKNWEMAFDHDANGVAIKGSLAELVSAIRNGADVQIVAHGPLADVLLKSQHVRVEEDGALVVANVPDYVANPTKTDVFHRIMLFRSNGTREILYGANSGYENNYANIPMTWYVNR